MVHAGLWSRVRAILVWVLLAQGILNYVILRPLMTAVSVVASLCNVYGDGKLRFDRVYIYVVAVNNFSQVCPAFGCSAAALLYA